MDLVSMSERDTLSHCLSISSKKIELRELFMNSIIKEIEAPLLKTDLPKFDVGDTVKVFVKIVEGTKERTQGYEGVIIKYSGHGVGTTITVRRVFQGIGIERVFLIHSPRVEKITVLRRGHVRRAKLYYLRERTGKATRIKEKVGVRRDADVKAEAKPAPKAEAKVEAKSDSAEKA
ncbi:MAG: large subunit ribosomal protein [Cyanobacteriota bacterium erpe_2018_sw_39hr_WHONDRS-SW48-000098_B_bin.30]|jgi:large subunit ribosomal protein L19|nr:large subunit ribosomal protein [Cyanobacteriota bacterium erpe_2018_sw_39hr_WHONDRS-SW48-000098_B_bin.30]